MVVFPGEGTDAGLKTPNLQFLLGSVPMIISRQSGLWKSAAFFTMKQSQENLVLLSPHGLVALNDGQH